MAGISFGGSLWAVVQYLKQSFTSSVVALPGRGSWGDYEARLSRYAVYWAHYENTAYDDVHQWTGAYKTRRALYRHTRGIYNPTKRLVDFWATHLMGGTIDPEAGDGRETPSCLPILTTNEDLRKAIAVLWRDSSWQILKEMYCRLGAALGDVGLKVVDDPDLGRVTIEVVHPADLEWVEFNARGEVTAYQIRRRVLAPRYANRRPSPFVDPRSAQIEVDYVELCWLEEETGTVHFETYLNRTPYPWNGVTAKWQEPYGFVPLVMHPHLRMSPTSFWGWPEIHPGHAKVTNLDDLASSLHDQIRKAIRPKWFFSGMANPARTGRELKATTSAPTDANPEPERQEMEAIYAGMGATAYPMVFDVNIQFTSIEIQNALLALEGDYPELRYDRMRAASHVSGEALRESRKPAEAKAHVIRAGYDADLVLIDKMAVSIAALRGYRDYSMLPRFDGLRDPRLDHRIGPRTVFNQDPLDIIGEEQAMLTAVATGKQSDIPPDIILERCGWDAQQIRQMYAARDRERQQILDFQRKQLELAAEFQPKQQQGASP